MVGDEAAGDREVGAALCAARMQAGLTVAEVAARIRVRPSIVDAIERGEGDQVLPRIYVRGHVRALAGVLDLDGDALLGRMSDVGDSASHYGDGVEEVIR